MKIDSIEISGYRSINDLRLQLAPRLTVVVGANGCGKSNIYQSISLIAAAANGSFARRIINEGGMNSILWAGRRHKSEDFRVRLAVRFEELRYELEFGRIPISERPKDNDGRQGLSIFKNDPDIKEESILFFDGKRKSMLLQRKRGTITARNMEGRNFSFPTTFTGSESVLFEISEPQKYPELQLLTGEFNKWRFYHDFRTDLDSPIRQPQMGTLTPIMSNDGRDLIAAIATIKAIGNANRLERALQQAFPDHILRIAEDVEVNDEGEETPGSGELTLYLTVPGLYRELTAMEFSDGTLQFLCLMGALLTPRPAPFMVLNEPETSIHPDLYEPIADLIVDASKKSQILMTTHAKQLAGIIKEKCKDARVIELTKVNGATTVVGSGSNLGKCDEEFDE